ncbi:ABC transporter substrate-binding protein [Cellulomonas marina]|uniref:Arabinosaccharide transport system substrate-binding protein n=1 Tax=Cellulomonas marina TaxID=988821 RepID=A0A1I0VBG3_9CELL|nr:extracellular solute-binding protein [Cellulomonas marina]GIG29163.1 putative arabinose-binding protein [Cellulomonas marina]SFA73665.1 arabinosaccharide transport system substrate-binding protein [Cellulomonas marina]
MTRTRRSISLAAAGVAGALVLAACSGGGGGGGEPAATNADGSTPLNMWVFAELHGTYYEQMADLWNEENPDRQVDLNVTVYPYDDMHNKLQLAANSGEGMPDLVDIEVSKFSKFVTDDGRTPLMDLTEVAEPYREDVVEARLDLYSRNDTVYGLPTHVGAFVTFYNAALLEAAGIDYTTIETWDDFQEAGAAYNAATGKQFGVASTGVDMVEPLMVAQLGGTFFDEDGAVAVNSPEVVEALEKEQEMQEAGAISTIPGGSPDDEEAFGAIANGDYAAIVYPAWYTSRFVDYMPDLAGDIAIAPAPTFEDGVVQTIGGGGTGTAVADSSPVKDVAAEWLAFAKLSPEANVAVWEVLGFDPVNMAIWEDEEVTKNPDNKFNQYFRTNLFDVLNEVKDGIGHFESFSNANLPAVDDVFTTTTFTQIFENGVPAKEALDQAQQDLENQIGG